MVRGIGFWDLSTRVRVSRHYVAFLVRYSHGGIGWDEAMELPMSELIRRVRDFEHWIKAENKK